jgi:hypothetical protein
MAVVKLLTQAEYAKRRGCSAVAVHKAVKAGRISLIGDKIDPTVADIQWERNTRARASNGKASPDGHVSTPDLVEHVAPLITAEAEDEATAPTTRPSAEPGYMQFRARREEADAEIAEMNAAKMRGAMLMRDDVDRAMFEIGRELRDSLTACARRIASEVASMSSAEACETVIDREHRIVLELLVTSFREKAGAGAKGASA